MPVNLKPEVVRYGRAVLAVMVALLLSALLEPVTQRVPFSFFYAAVAFSAGTGGFGPGLLAALLSVVVADYYILPPYHQFSTDGTDLLIFSLFLAVSFFISSLYRRQQAAEQVAQTQRESLRVTLLSIGDGVIAADDQGHITLMNAVAEQLTGWNFQEAVGQPIRDIFKVVNEQTQQPVQNPALRALSEGTIVGLANHSLLISKDGQKRPIDDSAAPIRDTSGKLNGVVLTFRDISERHEAERLAQRATQRTQRLQMVTAALSEAVLPADAAKVIVDQSVAALDGAYGALVALLSETTRNLEVLYSAGYAPEISEHWPLMPIDSPSPLATMVRSKQPLFLESREDWKRRFPDLPGLVTSGSLALLPLLIEGEPIGGMTVSFTEARTFSEEDQALFVALAQQCAQALWRTRLYEQARSARQQAVDTLESIGDAFIALDSDWRFTFANRRAERSWKLPPGEASAKTFWEVEPAPPESPIYVEAHRALSEHQPREVEYFSTTSNTWFAVRIFPAGEGLSLYFEDVSQRKRAERRLRLLTEASTVLASSLDYQTTLASVARLVVPDVADWCTVHTLEADGSVRQLAVAHKDPAKLVWAERIQEEFPLPPPDPNATQGLFHVIFSGESEFYPSIPDEMLVAAARSPRELEVMREVGYTAVMIVPLTARGRTLGAIQLVSAESGQHYMPDDLSLAEDLARRAGIAIDNARLYTEMREQRARLQVTLESIGDAVIATDAVGCVNFMNQIAESLTGWPQSEAIGKRLDEVFRIVNATTRQTVESPVSKVLREGTIVGLANHTVLLAKDGREIPIDDSGAPIRNDLGAIDGVILVFRDVSERQRAENDEHFLLEASRVLAGSLEQETSFQNLARLIVPYLADSCSVDIIESDGSLRRVAIASADPEKEAQLREMARRFPPQLSQPTIQRVLQSRQPFIETDLTEARIDAYADDPGQARLVKALGTRSLMRLPLIVRDRVIGLIGLGMAESGRHYAADDLAMAQELAGRAALALDNAQLYREAQNAINARSEFLSVAAHELKTPVTSLLGFSQTLLRQIKRRGTVNPEQLQLALTNIDTQSAKLTRLVNHLLDLSRLESGRLVLEMRPTDLAALVRDVVGTIQRNTEQHQIVFDGPSTLETNIDPLRLEQVLVNLLDNAIKYSPDGGAIELRLIPQTADAVQLAIRDHGIGVPVERRAQIFDRFYQAHRDGYLGGMGLGLFISRQIVELHGGRISAEFPDDGGTRFVIGLPLQRGA